VVIVMNFDASHETLILRISPGLSKEARVMFLKNMRAEDRNKFFSSMSQEHCAATLAGVSVRVRECVCVFE
jgi:hypothetical protein